MSFDEIFDLTAGLHFHLFYHGIRFYLIFSVFFLFPDVMSFLQRLAQLSEVHRRLLWKFGEVELERAAFDKKVRNR